MREKWVSGCQRDEPGVPTYRGGVREQTPQFCFFKRRVVREVHL
jgi:hypothetical protein